MTIRAVQIVFIHGKRLLGLNAKDRFLRVLNFKDVDRVPDYESGFWTETIDRRHGEGLPFEKRTFGGTELHFGLEGWWSSEQLPICTGLWPSLPTRTTEEKDGRAVVDDGMGGVYLATTETSSPPHYTRQPLRNRDDWDKLKPFFDPEIDRWQIQVHMI